MSPFIKLTPYSQRGSKLYLLPENIVGFRRKAQESATLVYANGGQQFDVEEWPEVIADMIAEHYQPQVN